MVKFPSVRLNAAEGKLTVHLLRFGGAVKLLAVESIGAKTAVILALGRLFALLILQYGLIEK